MGTRVETFAATIPAGTAKTAPTTVALPFNPGYLDHVDVIIPDGVSGLAGFYLAYGGQQLIPDTPNGWIVGNDDKFSADPDYAMVGQQWQLVGYNADINDHTFYVRAFVRELSEGAQVAGITGATPPLAIIPDATIAAGTFDLTPIPGDSGGVPADVGLPDLTGTVPVLDTTLGDAPAPDDAGDIAAPPALDPTLGDAPVVSDE